MEQNVPSSDSSNTNHRMSRIITKLFNRVLKAEGNENDAFSRSDFDLGDLLLNLEKVLSKSQNPGTANSVFSENSDLTDLDSLAGDGMAPCKSMCNQFMIELLKAKYSQNKISEVKISLSRNRNIKETFTGRLFTSFCNELGYDVLSPQKDIGSPSSKSNYDADQLSELIFAVGGAEEDEDRVNALDDLRSFVKEHPDINLESHLSGLSEPFRNYILEQMKSPSRPLLRQSSRSLLSEVSSKSVIETPLESNESDANAENMTMSEKLRYLKSKINAAEETAQTAMNTEFSTDLPQPPSDNPESPTSSSFMTLRQRLAAASEKRSNQVLTTEVATNIPFESAAMGNAAILRARLESVKRMNNLQKI